MLEWPFPELERFPAAAPEIRTHAGKCEDNQRPAAGTALAYPDSRTMPLRAASMEGCNMLRILLPLEPLLQLAGGQRDGMSMASSRVLESITAVNAQLACALKERGALICDVRCRPKWRAVRIPGALHVHLDSLHEVDLARIARKDTPLVFYGDGYGSYDAALAVRRAHDWGYREACWLLSGLPGWIAAGYPAEKPRVRPEQPACTNTRPDGILADAARFDGVRFDAG